MKVIEALNKLKANSGQKSKEHMLKFGMIADNALGISLPAIRQLGKEIGKDHDLAQNLWDSKFHEAKILATLVDIPKMVTEAQMEEWVKDFNSWDICDQCCSNLFDKTKYAYTKAVEWTKRSEEYVKRAGFVLMATLSVHDKKAENSKFEKFFPLIIKHSTDERNFVKKAVNWALRQIGKRNKHLNKKATETCKEIQKIDSRSAKWIAADALRELSNEKILKRLK